MHESRLALGDLLKGDHWDYSERRRDVRYHCLLEGAVSQGGMMWPCEILSVSRGGVSLDCEGALDLGALVRVSCPQPSGRPAGSIDAWVRRVESWGNRWRVSLSVVDAASLDEGSWLNLELKDLGLRARDRRQRRRAVRVPCLWPVELKGEGWSLCGNLKDLGMTGARVECLDGAPPDEPFLLRIAVPWGEDPLVVLGVKVDAIEKRWSEYRIGFRGFQVGGERELMRAMNEAYAARML